MRATTREVGGGKREPECSPRRHEEQEAGTKGGDGRKRDVYPPLAAPKEAVEARRVKRISARTCLDLSGVRS
jgi:hypothetical protein